MTPASDRVMPTLVVCICVGLLAGWSLTLSRWQQPAVESLLQPTAAMPESSRPKGDQVSDAVSTASTPLTGPIDRTPHPDGMVELLRKRGLRLPLDVPVDALKGHFEERRDAGSRAHEAVDLLAPRNTPVRAVDDGTIAKLFKSKYGGITVYQFDPTELFCYYYAHLERYADGIDEGQPVTRGQVIGFVGTSGNAPLNTPHLHFAVFVLDPDRHWWKGRAVDPYLVFTQQPETTRAGPRQAPPRKDN